MHYGIEKDDSDSLIAFKESLYEQTVKENIKLKKQVDQLESDKQNLIEKLEKIKYDLEFDRRKNNYSYLYDIKEILSILKRENQVTVK